MKPTELYQDNILDWLFWQHVLFYPEKIDLKFAGVFFDPNTTSALRGTIDVENCRNVDRKITGDREC